MAIVAYWLILTQRWTAIHVNVCPLVAFGHEKGTDYYLGLFVDGLILKIFSFSGIKIYFDDSGEEK